MSDATLTKKDFATDQEVRWCPGCGDYAILSAVQSVFPELGLPREKFVVISGIGCSSRFPYYMNTYGFHTIHGRAPTVATGVKLNNPELSVWIVTGDGDALSIGGNHIIHMMRRNVDVQILLFDNRIYGLTKGQYSPTSEIGKRTKSTPYGSIDRPFRVAALAVGARATFVARSIDTYTTHLKEMIGRAHAHRGTSFTQVLQNCNIFNDGAFNDVREKHGREENVLHLKHGEPLIFGKQQDQGIRLTGRYEPEVVRLGNGVSEKDLVVHDERGSVAYHMMLSTLQRPHFPLPIGVIRAVDEPIYDQDVRGQIDHVRQEKGVGNLRDVLYSGNTWDVK